MGPRLNSSWRHTSKLKHRWPRPPSSLGEVGVSLLFSCCFLSFFLCSLHWVLLGCCFSPVSCSFFPPFGLHSFDLGLGIGGRAVQTGSRAVPPLVPGCAVPMGLHSVFGRFHRSNPWYPMSGTTGGLWAVLPLPSKHRKYYLQPPVYTRRAVQPLPEAVLSGRVYGPIYTQWG